MLSEDFFYIQDTRSFLGNAVVWWGIDGGGYTANIMEAGKYTEEEAKRICKRKTDRAWPCDYIDNNSKARKIIIDTQGLNHKESRQWETKEST